MKIDKSTRSAKVFAAEGAIANPFLLCRVAAVYARRLQGQRAQFADCINKSLRIISDLPRGHLDAAHLPLLQNDSHAPESEMKNNTREPEPEAVVRT
ncbi:MAG TPA: hypothetical protein VFR84_06540 [Candidatus Angelobacter sp.]|nr:hypothetical protein [Candidatus Angelobacter sp.]